MRLLLLVLIRPFPPLKSDMTFLRTEKQHLRKVPISALFSFGYNFEHTQFSTLIFAGKEQTRANFIPFCVIYVPAPVSGTNFSSISITALPQCPSLYVSSSSFNPPSHLQASASIQMYRPTYRSHSKQPSQCVCPVPPAGGINVFLPSHPIKGITYILLSGIGNKKPL